MAVSKALADSDGAAWKQHWRSEVEARGHAVISTDDQISLIYSNGEFFAAGEVE